MKQFACFIGFCLCLILPMPNIALAQKADDLDHALARLNDTEAFQIWLDNFMRAQYGDDPPASVVAALKQAKPLKRVIELDRKQPEFTLGFWGYIKRVINPERITLGQQLYQQNQDLFKRVAQKYGVPAEILIAFWGLETGYGKYFGDFDMVSALATLAYDQRRSRFFRTELANLTDLIAKGAIRAENAKGSWAGAHGNFQFMPSSIKNFALDIDGNAIDLIHSMEDAGHSAGNYLQKSGWHAGERWGREILLPQDFSFQNIDQKMRPLSLWRQMGIMKTNGQLIDDAPNMQGRLLIPAGYHGPKFLIYDNFEVILRWNRSDLYALAVGLLSDGLLKPKNTALLSMKAPQKTLRLSRTLVKQVQQYLWNAGHDPKGIDGIFGRGSRAALRAWQSQKGLIPDGYIDLSLLNKMNIKVKE